MKPSTHGKPSIPALPEWSGMANSAPLRLLLTRLLALTNDESVEVETLRGSLRITTETFDALLRPSQTMDYVSLQGESITLRLEQRLNVAMKAVEAGADSETISRSLGWLEFEELSAKVFEANGFRVLRRFRFTAEGRTVGARPPRDPGPLPRLRRVQALGEGHRQPDREGDNRDSPREDRGIHEAHRGAPERIGICGWSKASCPHGPDPLGDPHGDLPARPLRLRPRPPEFYQRNSTDNSND